MRNLELHKINYLLHKGEFPEALDLFKDLFSKITGKEKDNLFFCNEDDILDCKNLISLFLKLSDSDCRLIPFSTLFSHVLNLVPSSFVFHFIYSHDFYERTVVDKYGLHDAFENPVEDYEEIINTIVSLCRIGFVTNKYIGHPPDSGQIILNQESLNEYYIGKWPEEFKVELLKRTEEACKQVPANVWKIRSEDYSDVNVETFLFDFFNHPITGNDVKLMRLGNLKQRNSPYLQSVLISLKKCLKECSSEELNELVLYLTWFENMNGHDFIVSLIDFFEDKNTKLEMYLK